MLTACELTEEDAKILTAITWRAYLEYCSNYATSKEEYFSLISNLPVNLVRAQKFNTLSAEWINDRQR